MDGAVALLTLIASGPPAGRSGAARAPHRLVADRTAAVPTSTVASPTAAAAAAVANSQHTDSIARLPVGAAHCLAGLKFYVAGHFTHLGGKTPVLDLIRRHSGHSPLPSISL